MEEFQHFIIRLQKQLELPLPGLEAQLRMAGTRRNIRDGKIEVPLRVKKAGVLLLIYPVMNDPKLVFIQRAEYPGVHSGQISFPGGAWEEGDQTMIDTALREAEEEIGISREQVQVIGHLSDLYIPPSNFLVTPVVCYTLNRPVFIPDPKEVSGILEISVQGLMSENTLTEKEITVYPAMKFNVPCFYIDGQVIWGATAMMLSELTAVIRSIS